MDELYGYYWAKIFGEQEYEELEKIVAVNILDYVKFKQLYEYHNCFDFRGDDLKAILKAIEFDLREEDLKAIKLTDKFEIHFLELPRIELGIGKDKLLDWLIYLYINE